MASTSKTMRIAVEGCGHGTLDAIYASVHKSCEVKGWDGVDLVIIGGDFQAVRNKCDLNVTAMPVKYRDMADFHHYYSETKTAPFLTIFVGGNHEASNHLFELYYGGWVAPNIYYLGAANVIQVGPLKIAGMSGIWKGYDYGKPHYERLPYNNDDMYSIYHVRELDVRKLLSFRSQVDIGISHDWPKGIEWLGDYNKLFKHKPFLREDAESGKLGNTAAKKVMDRLRPPYWFSAHLHTKYAAVKSYKSEENNHAHGIEVHSSQPKERSASLPFHASPHQEQLSAWNNFATRARQEEALESAKLVEEGKMRREEAERTGVPIAAGYKFIETYKKVRLGNGFTRDITSVSYNGEQERDESTTSSITQLDGCCASLPLKRRREASSPPNKDNHSTTKYTAISGMHADGSDIHAAAIAAPANPDAIDIDMSDDEETPLTAVDTQKEMEDYSTTHSINALPSATGDFKFTEVKTQSDVAKEDSQVDDASTLLDDEQVVSAEANKIPGLTKSIVDPEQSITNGVSEAMRAQLAALSSKFEEPVQVSASLPHPEDINNKETKFLALSKCEDKQNFLQLIEIQPYESKAPTINRPFKLHYVPEWLAILRVFAPELVLGGAPKDQVPQHRGDTFYRERIVEEEKWVHKNVVVPVGLEVPDNFSVTAATYDPAALVDDRDMPLEVTNPQTSAFCKLIGIENPFDISDEARKARILAGPRESTNTGRSNRAEHGGRGGRGGRGNRGGFSRGGRGRGNRGHGGRGRGRD